MMDLAEFDLPETTPVAAHVARERARWFNSGSNAESKSRANRAHRRAARSFLVIALREDRRFRAPRALTSWEIF